MQLRYNLKLVRVGFIGGTKIPPVERFGIGFVQGAKAAKSDIKIMYNYSGTFSDTNKGKTLAATNVMIQVQM